MSPPALTPAGLTSTGSTAIDPDSARRTHTDQAPAALAAIEEVLATLCLQRGPAAAQGLHPGLVVTDREGWTPAARLVDGSALPEVLDSARRCWQAPPHVAAALAWKSYTYWLSLPAVLSYTAARRMPMLAAENILVRVHDHQPFLTIGLRPGIPVAALPVDPITTVRPAGVAVVPDDQALLLALREALLARHLLPLLDQIRSMVNIGRRTLLGSIASGVAYAVVRTAAALPYQAGPDATIATAHRLLDALGVADLVDLSKESSGEVTVQRRTCCMAFTLPQPRICSGCCIRPV